MTKLREVEVTVIVPEKCFAVDVASDILRALRRYGADLAINVKICAIEEEDEEPKAQVRTWPMWCVKCEAAMVREDYDDKHDRYRCPGCDELVEVERVEA